MAIIQITDVHPSSAWTPEEVVGLICDVDLSQLKPLSTDSEFTQTKSVGENYDPILLDVLDPSFTLKQVCIYGFKYKILFLGTHAGDFEPCRATPKS